MRWVGPKYPTVQRCHNVFFEWVDSWPHKMALGPYGQVQDKVRVDLLSSQHSSLLPPELTCLDHQPYVCVNLFRQRENSAAV
jgi:hypothetical protein